MHCRFGFVAFSFCSFVLLTFGCSKKTPAPPQEGSAPNAKVAPDSTDLLKKHIAQLKGKSVERRAAAINRIAELNLDYDVTVPALIEALGDKSISEGAAIPGEPNSTREAAVLALLKLGEDGEKALLDSGLKILIEGLKDSTAGIKEHSALAIGLIGPKAKSAVPELLKVCVDPEDKGARQAAFDALHRIKDVPTMSIVALMKDPDPLIAYDAARFVSLVRPLPKEAIPILIDVLKAPIDQMAPDEAALNRNEAAEALASFGKDAESAVPALIGVMKATTYTEYTQYLRPRGQNGANGARGSESATMMALRKIGKPSISGLAEALSSKKPIVRWQAAVVLGGMGVDAKETLPALQKAFKTELESQEGELDVVGALALAMLELGDDPKETVAKLAQVLGMLKEEQSQSRFYVAWLLSRFGRKAESAVPVILPLLDDSEVSVRLQAATALRAIGPGAKSAIPVLVQKLSDEDERATAVATLKAMGPVAADAVKDLTKLLADPDESFRKDVVQALQAIGPAAKSAVPDMAKLLKPAGVKERVQVLEAFSAMGAVAQPAIPEIIAMVGERDDETRYGAVATLGHLESASPEVLAKLVEVLLKDRYMRGRIAAARALALLGPKAKSTIPDLQKFGESQDPMAKIWRAVALHRMGVEADANLQIVVAALKNKQLAGRLARIAALDAADLLTSSAKSVLPELIDNLNDKTPIASSSKVLFRERAVQAIGQLGAAAKPAVPKLTQLLKEPDEKFKLVVIEVLGQIGPDAEYASARLREVIRTADSTVADAAQEALSRIENK